LAVGLVVLMLALAMAGMCSATAPAATEAPAPAVAPARLADLVRDSWAAEGALDAASVAAAGASSTAHELSRFVAVGGVTPSAPLTSAPLSHEAAFARALNSSPWPAHLWPELTEIARCESQFDPSQVGDSGRSFGALQVHAPAWPRLVRAFDLLDLQGNLAAGWIVYVEAGHSFAPWSCWR
jgi:hypothetical protein